jgi:hypothetical protein
MTAGGGDEILPFGGGGRLDAGDVEEGGECVADGHAEHDDGAQDELVDDLAFVGHVRRVNGNARIVPAAAQIILKICSNVSGEKIKLHWGADMGLLSFSNSKRLQRCRSGARG